MGVLEGLKILDLSRLLPGPFCTRLLADMGAEVIKIEAPGRGDYAREFAPFRRGLSCWFMEVNRNKESMILDFKKPESRQIFWQLVRQADAVVESFRPGVLEKLGIDYDQAQVQNPKIVYCSLSGYGIKGPLIHDADHDLGYTSLAGLTALSGERHGMPAIPGFQAADMQAASLAALSILGAVRYAEKTGRGQIIHLSLFDAALTLMPGTAAAYFGGEPVQQRGEDWLTGASPNYHIYETQDGRYLAVACLEAKFWDNLCRVLAHPEWQSLLGHTDAYPMLVEKLTGIFKSRSLKEWEQCLDGQDTCVRPVLNFDETAELPQTKADEMILTIQDEELGTYRQMGFAAKFSAAPCILRKRAPRLGEDTERILASLAAESHPKKDKK